MPCGTDAAQRPRVKTSARWFLLAGPLALVACSEPAPEAASNASIPAVLPATLTLDQTLTWMAAAECEQMFSCNVPSNVAGVRAYFATRAECVAHDDVLPLRNSRQATRAMVRAGRQRFDDAKARACLTALRANPCVWPAACSSIAEGTTRIGEACTALEDCGRDAYCQLYTEGGGAQCPGVCVARVALGGVCDGRSLECADLPSGASAECRYDPTLAATRNPFRCVDPAAAGVAREGEVCTDYRQSPAIQRPCDEGLDCLYTNSATEPGVARCVGAAAPGQQCGRFCTDGALCLFDGTRFAQRCLPFVVQNAEGATCVQGNVGGEVCNVLRGLDCVAGRCRRVGTGAEGSPCFTARFGVSNCAPGLSCASDTQTCRRLKADGERCGSPSECTSGRCEAADGTSAVCTSTLGCR